MRRLALCLFVVGLMAMAVPGAWGQERGNRGGGFGFGGGLLGLADQKSVQSELKITNAQAKTIDELSKKQREGMRDLSQDERRKKREEISAANDKALTETLQPEQLSRLKQIQLQVQGVMAFRRPEVSDALQLTSEQKDKLKSIGEEAFRSGREAFEGVSREDAAAKRKELRKANVEKAEAVLTEEQKSKWKELTGAPFTGELRPPGGGGRNRGNGTPNGQT